MEEVGTGTCRHGRAVYRRFDGHRLFPRAFVRQRPPTEGGGVEGLRPGLRQHGQAGSTLRPALLGNLVPRLPYRSAQYRRIGRGRESHHRRRQVGRTGKDRRLHERERIHFSRYQRPERRYRHSV